MEEQITAAQKLINTLIEFFVNYSFQVLGALVILFIGTFVAKWVAGIVFKLCQKKNLDITLSQFLAGTAKVVILGFVIVVALGKFGITIAPFVAALGAAAFGATYAIQGPLSNYGAGMSIILGRPFVVGDTITVVGVSGTVEEVKLACTILSTVDGVRITVPNKQIVGEILHNSKKNKVAEGVIGVSYDSNAEEAVGIVRKAILQFGEVVTEPGPQVGIQSFGDSSINIGYRYWVPTVHYAQLSAAVNLAIYKGLKGAGVTIPFPQREVRILSQSSNAPSLQASR